MKASTMRLYLVTLTSQQSPDCDMVLVHDLDLARISEIHDSNVNKHHMVLVSSCLHLQSLETLQRDVVENHLQGSNAEIHTNSCRKRLLVSRFLLYSQKAYKKACRLSKMTSHESSEWQCFL